MGIGSRLPQMPSSLSSSAPQPSTPSSGPAPATMGSTPPQPIGGKGVPIGQAVGQAVQQAAQLGQQAVQQAQIQPQLQPQPIGGKGVPIGQAVGQAGQQAAQLGQQAVQLNQQQAAQLGQQAVQLNQQQVPYPNPNQPALSPYNTTTAADMQRGGMEAVPPAALIQSLQQVPRGNVFGTVANAVQQAQQNQLPPQAMSGKGAQTLSRAAGQAIQPALQSPVQARGLASLLKRVAARRR